ncbi:MAG: V-type ATPase subunit [Clostridia bacterium]|nr:V-type ATPase subunit [Clostridia bacterium]
MALVSKIYANTLASQNEKYLMDSDRLRRLIDADFSDAIKILQDYGKGDGLSAPSMEMLLSYETAKLVAFVRENAVSERVSNVLLSEFIFHNAKSAYKGRVGGVDVGRALYGGFEDVSEAVMEKEYSSLPDELEDCLVALDEKSEGTILTPREIDVAITKARYAFALKWAKGDKMLTRYVKADIDLKNLMTLLRCRIMELPVKDFSEMFIDGGSLKKDEMERALTASIEAFNLFYASTDYAEVFEGVEKGIEGITDFETHIDDYLYAITLVGKENFTSKSPFINYFYRAFLELKTIKTVLVCLKNDARDEIKRRLRGIYD